MELLMEPPPWPTLLLPRCHLFHFSCLFGVFCSAVLQRVITPPDPPQGQRNSWSWQQATIELPSKKESLTHRSKVWYIWALRALGGLGDFSGPISQVVFTLWALASPLSPSTVTASALDVCPSFSSLFSAPQGLRDSSLVFQWLRLHRPMSGMRVWSLVGELRSHKLQGHKNPNCMIEAAS